MAIETLFTAGDDALANHAVINIAPIPIFGLADPLRVRTTTFDIPEHTIDTYDVHWKTQSFTKPSGKIITPNEFSFTFRSDKYWTIYQALLLWKNYIGDEASGAMAEDVGAISGESDIRTDVSVLTEDSNGVPTGPGWKFHKAWISSLGGVSFDMESGDPITVDVTLNFLKMTTNT